jgi:ribose-phosphate pyrophosphokinase
VSHDWTDNRKNLMLFSGRAHPELAEQVAKELDVHVTAQTAREFANGEIFVRFDESVRGCDAFVLQSCPDPVNNWLMEALIMIDALKRGSAKRITAVMPFYPYARQDKKHRGREPISARLVADLFKTAGADRIVTVDLHTDQIQGSGRQHGRGLPRLGPGAHRREVGRRIGRRSAGLHSQDS